MFTVAPIAFGLDKFANLLVDWPIHLAPWINDIVPGSPLPPTAERRPPGGRGRRCPHALPDLHRDLVRPEEAR
ncbi:MAG: hypothetical protein ACRDTE_19305 [Pseudonocardiaceae bacterium]